MARRRISEDGHGVGARAAEDTQAGDTDASVDRDKPWDKVHGVHIGRWQIVVMNLLVVLVPECPTRGEAGRANMRQASQVAAICMVDVSHRRSRLQWMVDDVVDVGLQVNEAAPHRSEGRPACVHTSEYAPCI